MKAEIDIQEAIHQLDSNKYYNDLIVELFQNANKDAHSSILKREWDCMAAADKEEFLHSIGIEDDSKVKYFPNLGTELNLTNESGFKLVDLGLPSGILWMDRNVGANSPEDVGLYFAWGEIQGYTADEVGKTKQFSWDGDDYEFGSYEYGFTKYHSPKGIGTLETTDDSVLQNIHKGRMPSKYNIQELLDNTTYKWTNKDGVNGGLFTSKINDNSIFIPAGGDANGSLFNEGKYGCLWSSSLYRGGSYGGTECAWSLHFNNSGECGIRADDRCYGLSVRGVVNKL